MCKILDFGIQKFYMQRLWLVHNQNCTEQLVYFCEDVDCRDELQWKEADCYVI